MPTFQMNSASSVSAAFYLHQAKQAYSKEHWNEACRFAQLCLTSVKNDSVIRNSALGVLSVALIMSMKMQQALTVCLELNAALPNHLGNLNNLGYIFISHKRFDQALIYLNRAVGLEPSYIHAVLNLGFALVGNEKIALAKDSFLKVMALDPNEIKAQYGLAEVLVKEGKIKESLDLNDQILQRELNHFREHSRLIFKHHYLYPYDMQRTTKALQRFGSLLTSVTQIRYSELSEHMPLRVGIVSPDFCNHAVAYFLENTLVQIRQDSELSSKLILVGYYNRHVQDETTHRLRALFHDWRQSDEWDDSRLIEQIREDQIDILIDLSGHTDGNRLLVFAKKPAPLQVSWLGWFNSTGLEAMDYVLADPISVPTSDEQWFSEKVWRLPHLRYCFSIPQYAPDVSPLPSLKSPRFVFGCYQALVKINDGVLSCWSKILKSCPQADLRIQSASFDNDELRSLFIQRCNNVGLDLSRVSLAHGMERQAYFSSYAEVDILLDTFPYPGGTTTAEALWMGVPTLTLTLPGMLGRQGEALMTNAGLSDWVAQCEVEYVRKAIDLANGDWIQREALARLRVSMRERVRFSPVFNAQRFAVEFVDAMYEMWQRQCNEV